VCFLLSSFPPIRPSYSIYFLPRLDNVGRGCSFAGSFSPFPSPLDIVVFLFFSNRDRIEDKGEESSVVVVDRFSPRLPIPNLVHFFLLFSALDHDHFLLLPPPPFLPFRQVAL